MKQARRSMVDDARFVRQAVELIKLGARLNVLEQETPMSYERLVRLYKEVTGKSPTKGQIPYSTDWFLTWRPNVHASLYLNIHEYLDKSSEMDSADLLIKTYQLYLQKTENVGLEQVLSVTRAWRLTKFVDAGMLTLTACTSCKGKFVTEPYENQKHYVCGLCSPPARAAKGHREPLQQAYTSAA